MHEGQSVFNKSLGIQYSMVKIKNRIEDENFMSLFRKYAMFLFNVVV